METPTPRPLTPLQEAEALAREPGAKPLFELDDTVIAVNVTTGGPITEGHAYTVTGLDDYPYIKVEDTAGQCYDGWIATRFEKAEYAPETPPADDAPPTLMARIRRFFNPA